MKMTQSNQCILPRGGGRVSLDEIGTSGGGGINGMFIGPPGINGGGGKNGTGGRFMIGDPGDSIRIGDGAFTSLGIIPSIL